MKISLRAQLVGVIPTVSYGSLIIALLLSLWISAAQATNGARPPYQRFVPGIDVYPQNFAVAEDSLGNVYVGNSDGVLLFDGTRWTLTPLPNGDIVRSLAPADNGRIYVGGYDEFGYVETSRTGELRYVDLAALFREALDGELFADIWDIAVADEGIFFKAVQHVFFWSPDTEQINLWYRPERFGAIKFTDDVYLQFRGEGFRRYQNDAWQPLPGTSNLKTLISQLVPLPDGSLLTLARNGDWHKISNGVAEPYPMPANMPRSSKLTDGVLLDQETLAFSGDLGLLYLYNLNTGIVEKVALGQGFLSDLTRSRQGSLLATDDGAFHYVAWPAEWKLMDRLNGLVGSVYAVREVQDTLYALTGSGLFAKPNASDEFNRLDWSEHETWDLLDLEDGSMLLAESYVIRLVTEAGNANLTETIYPRVLVRSKFNPDLIYVGTELGLALLQRKGTGWEMVYHNSDMKNLRVSTIVETAENEILVGSERDGLQSVRFLIDSSWQLTSTHLDAEAGIRYGATPEADVISTGSGEILVATSNGFFRKTETGFEEVLQQLNSIRPAGQMISLHSDQDGNLWGYTYRNVYQQLQDGEWREEKLGNVRQGGINSMFVASNGDVMVGASASIMVRNPKSDKALIPAKKVMLRSVVARTANGQSKALPLDQPASIQQDTSITFSYALPDLTDPGNIRYRARLSPIEESFSDWSRTAEFTYYSLGPDEYKLEIEAKDSLGRSSVITPYTMVVEPYWYQLATVKLAGVVIGLILLVLLVFSVVRTRSRKLAAENQRLEHMVLERTRELASANRQLESLAHLDGLTSIPNRRRLDAYLSEVWQQCQERNRTMAIAMLDVDHFKQFNDEYGHPAGDELLKQLAQLLSHSLRRGEDLVARYGGEEFLVVLPGADNEAALNVAESMRSNVNDSNLNVTVSLGIATNEKTSFSSVDALIEASDRALYEAKRQGRNRVIAA